MKNQYLIIKYVDEEEVQKGYGNPLYYNEDVNCFMVKYPTIFTNKKVASDKLKYANKYATGSDLKGQAKVYKVGAV